MPTGAAVPGTCRKAYEKHMKNLKAVFNIYGSTEMNLCTLNIHNDDLGIITPGTVLKVH